MTVASRVVALTTLPRGFHPDRSRALACRNQQAAPGEQWDAAPEKLIVGTKYLEPDWRVTDRKTGEITFVVTTDKADERWELLMGYAATEHPYRFLLLERVNGSFRPVGVEPRALPEGVARVLNTWERRYRDRLTLLVRANEIRSWSFEPVKLRLGADWNCTYLPDFRVIGFDDVVEFHEVKGHWEEDARVKFRVAAALHPYRFIAWQYSSKRGWEPEDMTRPAVRSRPPG